MKIPAGLAGRDQQKGWRTAGGFTRWPAMDLQGDSSLQGHPVKTIL
jgi:hypothetical protein